MSTSSIVSMSSLSPLLTSSTQSSNQQSVGKSLTQLFQDIQSGNLSSAQGDLSTLTQQLSSNQTIGQTSQLSQLLTQLGTDLGSGNISGAQTAVQNYLSSQQSTGGTSSASGHHHHHHRSGGTTDATSQGTSSTTSSTGTSGNSVLQDLGNLLQSIQSGNLTAAQSAYASLTEQLGGSGSTSGTNNSTVASVSSASSNPFQQLLNSLGNSLSSGDITAAQQDLQSFFQNESLGSGTLVTANA